MTARGEIASGSHLYSAARWRRSQTCCKRSGSAQLKMPLSSASPRLQSQLVAGLKRSLRRSSKGAQQIREERRCAVSCSDMSVKGAWPLTTMPLERPDRRHIEAERLDRGDRARDGHERARELPSAAYSSRRPARHRGRRPATRSQCSM